MRQAVDVSTQRLEMRRESWATAKHGSLGLVQDKDCRTQETRELCGLSVEDGHRRDSQRC